MHALELETHIDPNHQIHLQLPSSIATQKVKVIVMYEDTPKQTPLKLGLFAGQISQTDDFNDPLPDNFWLTGKP